MACTIDAGDHSDIHPGDKWTVAKRLVHEALRLKYGRAGCLPGPRGESVARVQYCYQGYPPAANIYRRGDGLPLFPFSLSLGSCPHSGR